MPFNPVFTVGGSPYGGGGSTLGGSGGGVNPQSPSSQGIAVYNVDNYGVPLNSAPGAAKLLAMLALIGATKATIYVPPGTIGLETNVTIPSNVRLWMAKGAEFVATVPGVTLTLNGDADFSDERVFNNAVFGFSVVFGPKLRQNVRPEWWGAVGDAATDDTVPLQYALNALVASGGGSLWFGCMYALSATLNITAPDITLFASSWASGLKALNPNFHMVTPSIAAHRFKAQGLRFIGAAPDGTTVQFGIVTLAFAAPDDCEVRGCMFGNYAAAGNSLNNGVKVDGGNRWKIIDNTFAYLRGSISGCGYAVLCGTTNRLIAKGNHFTGSIGWGRHAVYLSGGCTDCIVTENNVNGLSEEAFPIFSQAIHTANTGNRITNNTVIGGGQLTATGAALSIFGKSSKNVIAGNYIDGYQGFGIVVHNASTLSATDLNVIRDNTIRNVAWHGIATFGATKTLIHGNEITDIGQASAGTYAGIKLDPDGATITANSRVRKNSVTGAAVVRCGLWLDASTTGTYSSGNHFPDGIVGKILTTGAPLVSRNDENGLNPMSANNGDVNVTFQVNRDAEVELFASALTANRVVTLSATDAYKGAKFRILRTGLGAFTLDVGGVKTIPASTAAWVDVLYDGAAWKLTGYGTL